MKAHPMDNGPIMSVANVDDDAVDMRLAGTLARLPQLLAPRSVREIESFAPTHSKRNRAREQLAMSEAAIAAVGQSSRSLCEQQDQLYRLHGWFGPGGDKLNALLRSLAWARIQGHRSALLAQIEREADLRNGRPISPEVKLPDGGDGGGNGAKLELVPLDPEDEDPEDTGGGASGSGGAAPAVPAVVVAPTLPYPAGPGADVNDDDDDGLGFLSRDR